jgi:predicted TIM-barrel fold metal-dependent hydrolase
MSTYSSITNEGSYRLVDSDAHINEPPGLWIDDVPSQFKDRVPQMKRFEHGDAWVMEGVADPINFGNNVSGALFKTDRGPWAKFDEMPKGGYDPAERLNEMDLDMVDAAVQYPTPRISQLVFGTQDPDLHLYMVQRYNDWLIEYCSYEPSRLGAIVMLPNRGVDQALQEWERVADRTGVVGALMGCYPHGDKDIMPEDDVVFRAVAERGMPLHVHVKLVDDLPYDMYAPGRISAGNAAGDVRFLDAPAIMVQFMLSGVFDRIPELTVVLAEVDAGWVPYVKEQMDNRFRRRNTGGKTRLVKPPSEIIAEHFYYTYITDHVAIQLLESVGPDRLMWSSDFPHTGTDWPNSWITIDADFAGVEKAKRELVLAGNAQRLYKFGQR